MAKLRVFNKFEQQPIEEHELQCLESWLIENCPSYDESASIFTATLNGKPFVAHSLKLKDSDIVNLTLEPRDPLTALAVIAIIGAGYALYQAQQIPDFQDTSSSGNSIYEASSRANRAEPSGVIRSIAGRIDMFPDYVVPPVRRYIDHEEFLYFHFSIGEGYFDISSDNFFISESSASSYEGDIEIEIFEPGDDASGNIASQNWFETKEVSSLDLITSVESLGAGWTLDYSGDQMTSYFESVATQFPVSVDGRFEITNGTNPGFYQVVSLSGASNETATLIGLKRAGDDTTRLEAVTKIDSTGRIGREINIFTSTGLPSLITESGEAIEWGIINGGVNWEGPFLCAPRNELSSRAEVDVVFPQGLVFLDGNGDLTSATVDIEIQWRDFGTTTWNTVPSTSFTADTYNQRAYTVDVEFGSNILPEFQVRRVTKDSEDINLVDVVQIKRIKSQLEAPVSYQDITTTSIKIRGTNALASTSENKINIRGATRKLPTISELQALSWDLRKSQTQVVGGWNVSGAEFFSSFSLPAGNISGYDFSDDGSRLYYLPPDDNRVFQFLMSSPFSITTAVLEEQYIADVTSLMYEGKSIELANGGTRLYVLTETDLGAIAFEEHTLSTAYDISTASRTETFNTGITKTGTSNITISLDGLRLFFFDGDAVNQYSMSAFDLSTLVDDSVSFAVTGDSMALKQVPSETNPQLMYIRSGSDIETYEITDGDITTATLDDTSGSFSGIIRVYQGKMFDTSGESITRYTIPDTADTRATRSIARFVGYSLYKAMGNEVVDLVDWDQLSVLDTLWFSRGDFLDAEFKDETTLWEALKLILAVGYAEPSIRRGKFYPVRIAQSDDFQQIYTPDIMLDGGVQVDHVHYDNQEPDGVNVEYFSTETGGMEVVNSYAPGDLAVHPSRLSAIGITDPTRAWRYGMRKRNMDRYKPATISFSTEMDALNSNYGDLIAISSEMFAHQYGMIIDYDEGTNRATLDFDLDYTDIPELPPFGTKYGYLAVRDLEGRYETYQIQEPAELNKPTIILNFTPIFDGSVDLPMVSFGPPDDFVKLGIVRKITQTSETQVNIACEEYLEEVYQDDDNEPS